MKAKKEEVLGGPFSYQPTQKRYQVPPTALEKSLMRLILKAMGKPNIEVILWDGKALDSVPDAPAMVINERASLWRLLIYPTLHFGDDYSSGRIEIHGDLEQFIGRFYESYRSLPSPMKALQTALVRYHHLRGNPHGRARDNIYHHYDIGNDFYRLWLDEGMVYTCAYYAPGITSLEAAQQAKMELVCRKLRLKPGETVVEAGCGWGALSRYMARHYGVKVRAYNVSHEQVAYAREQARAEGLDWQVEFVEEDYRNISGSFDAFVSVGMLEHVGVKHFPELGALIDRCLKPDGRGLIHSIGQNRPLPTSTWTQRRIFPGGYPPTLCEMTDIFAPYDFSIQDVENLRLHYAQTLQAWLERFELHQEEVRELYDDNFVRAWRLYLTGSMSHFNFGALQLYQVLFSRANNNSLPTSRDDIYHDSFQ